MPEINDTNPEANEVQIQMLRRASTTERIARTCSLSSTVIKLSRRAIRRNRPAFSDCEVKLEFISLHYGKTLAEQVRRYISEKTANERL